MENKNPLSPHIQIYRWHISSLVSISHRITGIINIVAITLICIWVSLLIFGDMSPKINKETHIQISVIATILIIPVIRCEIDTNDEMCHL